MLFSAALFALSFVHASVAASLNAQPTASILEKRGCTPKKSPTPGPADAVTFEPFDVQTAQQYRYRKQIGANAGSWFVHEEWMDNDPFQCAASPKTAEINIASGWSGVSGAQTELEWHWDTWITQSDFEKIAGMGVNTVRLPIGYWSLGKNWTVGTPFENYGDAYVNSWSRVLRAVKWCEQYKIGVLIDLHGAPGSQNGQAHSGISDGKAGLWGNDAYIKQTQAILVWLAEQFQYVNNVVGLELLNEPKYGQDLLNFYKDTIPMIRAVAKTIPIYLHDGFNLNSMVTWVVDNCKDYQPCIIDHHNYYVFQSSLTSKPITQITSQIQGSDKSNLAAQNKKLNGNLVVGEMGCATADGQSVSNMDTAVKDYCQAQVDVYSENTAGWIFWAILTSGCTDASGDGWCFIGSVGKYLPKSFVVPSGEISSGGVTITGGSGPTNGNSTSTNDNSGSGSGDSGSGSDNGSGSSSGGGNSSTSGDNSSSDNSSNDNSSNDNSSSGNSSNDNSSSTTASVTNSGSSSKSCSANKSNTKKRSNRHHDRHLSARALDTAADNRRRHHTRIQKRIVSDKGYTEGHVAAGVFARANSRLGMEHAYIQARMQHLGISEDHIDDFKEGFQVGHQEGRENWSRRR